MRAGRFQGTLTNRTGLINGLTMAQQDPNMHKGTRSKKSKDKKRVGASESLLKK